MASTTKTEHPPTNRRPSPTRACQDGPGRLRRDPRACTSAMAVPWVVGYSGGKDSSAALQLVWMALRELPAAERTSRSMSSRPTRWSSSRSSPWVDASLARMRTAAASKACRSSPHKLTPEVEDTFWVNLIGKGYPAPRQQVPLVHRAAQDPAVEQVHPRGRPQQRRGDPRPRHPQGREPAAGTRRWRRHGARRVRDRLTPNASLPNSLVYTPIEDWTNDDVWLFLMQVKNPWGHDNKSLLGMYQGARRAASARWWWIRSTPSCGDSRFGCWVCTVVDKDRSMEAMIKNDEEKVWMTPLLELRNELDKPDDRDLRDFRRMNGQVQLFHDRTIPGPYTKESREHWLRRVLEAQQSCAGARAGPSSANLNLITLEELHEIRRIWLNEKHEFDDSLPRNLRGDHRAGVPRAKRGQQPPAGRRLVAAEGGLRRR